MANIAIDKALTSLSEKTAIADTDMMYVVTPSDTASSRSRKATIATLRSAFGTLSLAMAGDLGTDQDYDGMTLTGITAGEALSAWELVYLDETEEQWLLADANAAGKFPAVGLVVAACAEDAEATVLVMGTCRNDTWTWTAPGKAIYLSITAGTLTETAPTTSGDCVQIVGRALASNIIYFHPYSCWIELA